jgi:hypothetical protein
MGQTAKIVSGFVVCWQKLKLLENKDGWARIQSLA